MKKLLVSAFALSMLVLSAQAGNEQKSGTSGASELLINPWVRSSGMASANTAGVMGVESIRLNVGGLSRIKRTEVLFANTQWLKGSDVSINALGLAQPVGDNGGVIGFEIMSMNLGKFYNTTTNNPEGNNTFSVNFTNLGLSYSKAFSKSIHGGITVRIISESIPNASAVGVGFDAGVQYVTTLGTLQDTSATDNFRIGVSLRNVGPPMRFTGDGLTQRVNILSGNTAQEESTVLMPTESFEIPSTLNIGAAYDIMPATDHRITFAGNFNSNSYTTDQFQGGAEYGFMNRFMVRAGVDYQNNIFNKEKTRTAHSGLTAGASVAVPFGTDKAKSFGIDYSFRSSSVFSGTHGLGIRLVF